MNCYVPIAKGEMTALRDQVIDKAIDWTKLMIEEGDRNIILLGDFNKASRMMRSLQQLGMANFVQNPTHRGNGRLD